MPEAEFLPIIRRILDWEYTEEDRQKVLSVIKEAIYESKLYEFLSNYYLEVGDALYDSIFTDFCFKLRAKKSLFERKTRVNRTYLKSMIRNSLLELANKSGEDASIRKNYAAEDDEDSEDVSHLEYLLITNPESVDYMKVERAFEMVSRWTPKKKEVLCQMLREIYEGSDAAEVQRTNAFYKMWSRIKQELKKVFDLETTDKDLEEWALRVLSEICDKNNL
uniref:Uncharacterized protein n=1 Tax=candidate division WOR-3 bacterium TaxID=2052148 RepID=A0A7C2PA39_UNCW3